MENILFDFIPVKLNKMRPMLSVIARVIYLVIIMSLAVSKVIEHKTNELDRPYFWAIVVILCLITYFIVTWGSVISLNNKGFTKRTFFNKESYDWVFFKDAKWDTSFVGVVSIKLITLNNQYIRLTGSYSEHYKVFDKIVRFYKERQKIL